MKKRIFDIVISLAALLVLLPVIILVSIVVLFSMGFPIFFIQDRVGRHGKTFRLIKFRTMYRAEYSSAITLKGEMRITPVGSLLRKYKLDELPELINVILGSMSLVGPRPDVPGYADQLKGDDRKILKLRPGITGPATLKYAHEEKILAEVADPIEYNDEVLFPDKVRINKAYFENHSLWGDVIIIYKTIFRKY